MKEFIFTISDAEIKSESQFPEKWQWLSWPLVPFSVFLFDFLFWDMQGAGINFPLFTVSMLAFAVIIHFRKINSVLSFSLICSTVLTGIAMVVVHSQVVFFIHLICWGLTIGKILQTDLRSLPFVALAQLINFIFSGFAVLISLVQYLPGFGGIMKFRKAVTLAAFPVIIGIVFYWIYLVANPRFESLNLSIFQGVLDWISAFFTFDLVLRFIFWTFGFFLSTGILFRIHNSILPQIEKPFDERLFRVKKVGEPPIELWKLKNEFKAGIILLILLNTFLLIVNLTDISWIWWNFVPERNFSLSQFVHEGTWLLIFSIGLAAMVVLFLFRGDLNFFSKNKFHKSLACAWIIQNAFLAISVGLRNYHYVSYYGLTGKRIGVIVFLILVLAGLISLFLKIIQTKSLFYLFKVNGWLALFILATVCCFDFNRIIIKYNLSRIHLIGFDLSYHYRLSPSDLPLIWEVRKNLHNFSEEEFISHTRMVLEQRKITDWRSWNLKDAINFPALELIILSEKPKKINPNHF